MFYLTVYSASAHKLIASLLWSDLISWARVHVLLCVAQCSRLLYIYIHICALYRVETERWRMAMKIKCEVHLTVDGCTSVHVLHIQLKRWLLLAVGVWPNAMYNIYSLKKPQPIYSLSPLPSDRGDGQTERRQIDNVIIAELCNLPLKSFWQVLVRSRRIMMNTTKDILQHISQSLTHSLASLVMPDHSFHQCHHCYRLSSTPDSRHTFSTNHFHRIVFQS